MVERFLSQTSFTTQEDFIKNFKINVPENFNFGYDVVREFSITFSVSIENPHKNRCSGLCSPSVFKMSVVRWNW